MENGLILPRKLIEDNKYFNLSAQAKIIYIVLLDKFKKEKIADATGREYIHFSREDISTKMGFSMGSTRKYMQELQDYKVIKIEGKTYNRYPRKIFLDLI